jgi:hypothetical protein
MIITCPNCQKRHKLPEDWSANKVRCSRCGEKFFLDELASEFITLDEPQKENIAASSSGDVPRASRAIPHLRLAIGIAAVLVIAGAAAFYFLRVAPENKFRQAMREGQGAENAGRCDEALNAYYRAELLRPNDSAAEQAQLRVLEKRRLAEYSKAMARAEKPPSNRTIGKRLCASIRSPSCENPMTQRQKIPSDACNTSCT